jgi:hypothetical protein
MNDLKKKIIDHCAWIAKYDRTYAIAAFEKYNADMPWLCLKEKK